MAEGWDEAERLGKAWDDAVTTIAALRAKLEAKQEWIDNLEAKLEQAEAALRPAQFDIDGLRLKLELKTNVVREVVEHRDRWHTRCDAAEARVRELEQEKATAHDWRGMWGKLREWYGEADGNCSCMLCQGKRKMDALERGE
jgi:chromosome segregation ATPase